MTAPPALDDLLARLGAELDFDVARHVAVAGGSVDAIWFDRCLPLAAVAGDALDLAQAPVLPLVAFVAMTAPELEASEVDLPTSRLEATGAPLRILVIGRNTRSCALAPSVQSIEQLQKREEEAALRARIVAALRTGTHLAGRTIVMLQSELVEWARRLREVRPRSYSAESLFNRTGAID
ncbi:MAG: hypothetical protein ABW186_18120 [Rhodanobacteraceae bacterium]